MAAFSEVVGMHPWDVERLTAEQFDGYAEYVEKRIKGDG